MMAILNDGTLLDRFLRLPRSEHSTSRPAA